MPGKGIPDGITKDHLEVAISLIDSETPHLFADSTKFDVYYNNKRYPPKAVVGIAAGLVTGLSYAPRDFSGGLGSKCFRILKEQGFNVVPKVRSEAAQVYRVTGPPENFITAMTIGYWALNSSHEKLWNRLEQGDILLFHSTTKSQFKSSLKASLVGYARVGSNKFKKNDLWWIQEIDSGTNEWPFAFSLDQVCLMKDLGDDIDLSRGVHEKPDSKMRNEVIALSESGIPIQKLNQAAKSISPDLPNFPFNGSMSGLNDVYRELIFSKEVDEWFVCHGKTPDQLVEDEFFSTEELNDLSQLSKSELLELATKWSPPYSGSHKRGWRKTRKEDAKQKKLVAQIEDHICQVCGFFCEYLNPKGKKLFVIHVDHIIEKSSQGDESLENLWVLCPNCHAKKTAGLIEIDLDKKKIFENGGEIMIRDSHLFI